MFHQAGPALADDVQPQFEQISMLTGLADYARLIGSQNGADA
jgi:hypothetical protein